MFPTQSDQSLIKQALMHIKSGKFHTETNEELLRNILYLIASARNRQLLVDELGSHVASLKMEECYGIKHLVELVSDPAYCDRFLERNFTLRNYSNATFKTNMENALNNDSEWDNAVGFSQVII